MAVNNDTLINLGVHNWIICIQHLIASLQFQTITLRKEIKTFKNVFLLICGRITLLVLLAILAPLYTQWLLNLSIIGLLYQSISRESVLATNRAKMLNDHPCSNFNHHFIPIWNDPLTSLTNLVILQCNRPQFDENNWGKYIAGSLLIVNW